MKGVGKSDQGLQWQAGAGARGRAAGAGGETRVRGKRREARRRGRCRRQALARAVNEDSLMMIEGSGE